MTWLWHLLDTFGFYICQQLPERTAHAGDVFCSVCFRCCGLYLGFIAGIVPLVWRIKKYRLTMYHVVVGALMMAATFFDAIFWRYTPWANSNDERAIFGFVGGIGVALVFGTIALFFIQAKDGNRYAVSPLYYLVQSVLSAIISVIFALFLIKPTIFGMHLLSLLSAIGLGAMTYLINLSAVEGVRFFIIKKMPHWAAHAAAFALLIPELILRIII